MTADKTTKRPIAGYIAVNPLRVKLTNGNHRGHINLVVHEILHIMGLNFNCFKMFPSKDGLGIIRQDGKGRFFLVSEKVVREARSHFDCPSATEGRR